MASDDFYTATKRFLEWCNQIGIRISPKVALVDLRAEGRGRGLGKFFSLSSLSTPR
jgi:hypothetical protein